MLQKCKVNFAEVLKNKKISVQSKDIYMNKCVNCRLILYKIYFRKCHMADRPSTSAARVGRPRTRSVHQTSCVVGSKLVGPGLCLHIQVRLQIPPKGQK